MTLRLVLLLPLLVGGFIPSLRVLPDVPNSVRTSADVAHLRQFVDLWANVAKGGATIKINLGQ